MKIFLVLDETRFYQPDYIAHLLRQMTDNVVGAALVVTVPASNNIEKYIAKNWKLLKFTELLELGTKKYYYAFLDFITNKSRSGRFYSVRSVFNAFKIQFFEVKYNINKNEYLERIRNLEPDIILSSNSLIFKEEILSLPTKCCLNRHSSLLPSYGGLWPVFQAVRSGEEYVGASVHTMVNKIDKGIILAQRRVPVEEELSISELYKKCFEVSVDATLEALEKVRNNDFSPIRNDYSESYFSFPKKKHWDELRQRGKRFI